MFWKHNTQKPTKQGQYVVAWLDRNGMWKSNVMSYICGVWRLELMGLVIDLPEEMKNEFWYQRLPSNLAQYE